MAKPKRIHQERRYRCYECDCPKELSLKGWRRYYQKQIDKSEYPDFTIWMADMTKTGLLVPA